MEDNGAMSESIDCPKREKVKKKPNEDGASIVIDLQGPLRE